MCAAPQATLRTQAAVAAFVASPRGGQKILTFIRQLGRALQGHRGLQPPNMRSPHLIAYRSVLTEIQRISDGVQPLPKSSQQRYGNLAFRDFLKEVEEVAPKLVDSALSPYLVEAEDRIALTIYLTRSFGNGTRIDYGSGHELNFVASLIVLTEGVTDPSGDVAGPEISAATGLEITLGVLLPYIELVRMLQSRYQLEPAGSRGVWGLDDYQFVPFLLGSYQLSVDESTKEDLPMRVPEPKDSVERSAVTEYAGTYLYFNMISHIMNTKGAHAPFHLTSPMLHDIAGVESWEKIARGFDRMFLQEVLSALPIMQHFPVSEKTFL